MKPYYDRDGITIYHADCREVLPTLEPVDLVLTDPPYGINYQSNSRTVSPKMERLKNDQRPPLWSIDILPQCKAVVLFSRWDVIGVWKSEISKIMKVGGVIIWFKPGGGMGDLKRSYALDYETILYASSESWNLPGKRFGSVWECTCDSGSKYQHPTQKPVGILRMCVERFCVKEDMILDPFMGSGTTLRAAKDLGRKAIGIEIEERYCEIAANRLEQQVFDFGDDIETVSEDDIKQQAQFEIVIPGAIHVKENE